MSGPSDLRTFGLPDHRTSGLPDHRTSPRFFPGFSTLGTAGEAIFRFLRKQHSIPLRSDMRPISLTKTLASAGVLLVVLLLASCGGTRSASTPAQSEKSVPVVVSDLLLPAPPALDTVRAGEFDFGKMWTFDFPPIEYFNATYSMLISVESATMTSASESTRDC